MSGIETDYKAHFNVYLVLIEVATILSFLTAPFYAICNYLVFNGSDVPEKEKLGMPMKIYSIISIVFLIAFSGWFVSTLF